MRCLFLCFFLCLSIKIVLAQPDLTCWNIPSYEIVVDITAQNFTGTKKGNTGTAYFDRQAQSFGATCKNDTGVKTSAYSRLKGITRLTPSEQNPGFYKLSDDVDVKIYSEPVNEKLEVPFENYLLAGTYLYQRGEHYFADAFVFGAKGTLSMILRRDIIGGAITVPFRAKLIENYRKWGAVDSDYASISYLDIVTSGKLIPVPVICKINNNVLINVEFGRMSIEGVKADLQENYNSKVINLIFSCSSALSSEVKVNLIANPSSFNDNLIISNNTDVGFLIMHNGKPVPPYGYFSSSIIDGSGSDVISVTPIKNPDAKKIKLGEINSSATLILSLP